MLRSLSAIRIRRSQPHDKSRRGVAAIEFALISPVFFLFLMGTMEVSLVFLVEHLLENATYNASRLAKTGYIEAGKTQEETVSAELLSRLSGLEPLISPGKLQITATSYGNLSDIGQPEQGTAGFGTPEQIMVYTVSYPWEFFTPMIGNLMGDENQIMTLSSRIVVRNEPYNETP